MDEEVRESLQNDRVIDITTTGRRSGEARRIEVSPFFIDGTLFLTGTPLPRSWYANLRANPSFTLHLKQSLQRDIPATAKPVLDPARRRRIFQGLRQRLAGRLDLDIDTWMAHSPLVEVTLEE